MKTSQLKPLHLDSSIVIPLLSGIFGTREDKAHPNNKKAVEYRTDLEYEDFLKPCP